MNYNDSNPVLIQCGRSSRIRSASYVPLILIHDGGGTIFSYFLLDDLNRPVYGIGDPLFEHDEPWVGGLDEMSEHYAEIIAAMPYSSVLLGGWSLGGLLSLKIANILATMMDIQRVKVPKVRGILLIDSPNPDLRKRTNLPSRQEQEQNMHTIKPSSSSTTRLVQNSMRRAVSMLQDWTCPPLFQERYEGDASDEGRSRTYTHRDIHRKWHLCHSEAKNSRPVNAPPTVLLRCVDTAPVKALDVMMGLRSSDSMIKHDKLEATPSVPQCFSTVDTSRSSTTLGWHETVPGLLDAVIDVDGHHFDLFRPDRVATLTASIDLGIDMLLSTVQA